MPKNLGKAINLSLIVTLILSTSVGVFLLFQRAETYQVKRVINGTYTMATDEEVAVVTVTATPMAMAKTFVFASYEQADTTLRTVANIMALVDSPTELLLSRFTSGDAADVDYYVVEFAAGANVTSAITTLSAAANQKNITLPRDYIKNYTFPIITYKSYRAASSGSEDERNTLSGEMYDSDAGTPDTFDTLIIKRNENFTRYNLDIAYQVVEFDRDVFIQHGSATIGDGDDDGLVQGVNLTTPVNASKSFLVFSRRAGVNIGGIESDYSVEGALNDAGTLLNFTRGGSGDTVDVAWSLIEFENLAFIARGRDAISGASLDKDIGASLVLSRTMVKASAGIAAAGTKELDEVEVRFRLTNQSNLHAEKASATYGGYVSWFVAELPPFDIISPNGDNQTGNYSQYEVWRVGETKNIVWNYADDVASNSASIKLCKDNSTDINNYTTTINSSITGSYNNGSYAWTIPNTVGATNPIGQNLRIAVVDNVLGTRNYDCSNGRFEIKGTINLTYPDTATTWYIGETKSVTWTKTGNFNYTGATFNITFSSNGGGEYNNSLVPGLENLTQAQANCGEADDACFYNVTVPAAFGSNYRVKVSLNSDSLNVTDNSTQDFSITGELTLAVPDGGQNWTVGETNRYINWTKLGDFSASSFNISLYDNGVYNTTIEDSLTQAAACTVDNCSYNWNPVGDKISNTLAIRVAANLDPDNIKDESSSYFTIRGLLDLVYPDGGQSFVTQTNETITWNKTGTWAGNQLNLSYGLFNASSGFYDYTYINATDAGATNGSYVWLVSQGAVGTLVKIKIESVQSPAELVVSDVSTTPFNVTPSIQVNEPSTDDTWYVGQNRRINWTAYGIGITRVHVFYHDETSWVRMTTDDNGTLVNNTGDGPPPTGEFWWTVHENATNKNLTICVSNRTKDYQTSPELPFANASGLIKVKGSVDSITHPGTGGNLTVGAIGYINWTYSGLMTPFIVQFSKDGTEGNFVNLTTNAPASGGAGSYAWDPVYDNVSISAKVRVLFAGDTTVNFTSGAFNVKPNIQMLYPGNTSGQELYVGDVEPINWSATGTVGSLQLQYYNGSDFVTLDTVASGSAPWNWTVNDTITTQSWIRLKSVTYPTMSWDSANAFKIRGILNLTAPDGNEIWRVGDIRLINWTRSATMGNISIELLRQGLDPYLIFDTIYSSLGQKSWTVEDNITSTGQIRISLLSDSTINDTSQSYFFIKGNISMVKPVGGETALVEEYQNITWYTKGSIAQVNITYSTQGNASYNYPPFAIRLSNFADNYTSYLNWKPTSDDKTTSARIKIEAVGDEADTYANSWDNFTIKGWINL
ncbi:MAG: hypothetical protein ACYSSL_07755, partial [Planctomycetota bacterium]